MAEHYSYSKVLESSDRNGWRIDDIIGGEKRLDFDRPFLPEILARVEPLGFLGEREKRTLNQIRGYGYLSTFGLVEEFILPFVLDHARPHLNGDPCRTRALLRFAAEEAKHIDLFKRFASEFQKGFVSPCGVIGPASGIVREVLSNHPLGVALAILQIEWMTQRHYLDSVHDGCDLDVRFKSLLHHHWIEESQHVKLDTLIVAALAADCTSSEILKGFEDYRAIVAMLDAGLHEQVQLDLLSLQKATHRTLTASEQEQFRSVQIQALRWTYVGSGMTHSNFLETVETLDPAARSRIAAMATTFC